MNTTLDIKTFPSPWGDLVAPKSTLENPSFHFLAPVVETYYRSKAFVSQTNINPLIAASAPLFFLIEKIQNLYSAPDVNRLRDDLIHEIRAFEHQAQVHGYRPYMILAVRHVISLWADQTILSKPWGESCQWEKIQLPDNQGPDQENAFYLLLSRCLQEPTLYLDLLELFYLCLSLGFQGTTALPSEANNFRIAEARNCLFETIHKQRIDFSKQLEVDTSSTPKPHKNFSSRSFLRPSIVILMGLFLTGVYIMLNTYLDAPMSGIHAPLSFSEQPIG